MRNSSSRTLHSAIACEGLIRYLGKEEARVQVLKTVSLQTQAGKVYSIMGPSGCGKSTLLYLLGLLDKPDAGKIWIGGQDVAQLSDRETDEFRNREIGFVFQFHFLIKEFTALENVMMPMRKAGTWSYGEMRDRARFLLKAVDLEDKVDRRTNHLSGGEQQRVAVARALANSPRVVLADEPTGNLDTYNSQRVFKVMTDMARQEKLALLVVTHNPHIAETSDEVLSMENGYIIKSDSSLNKS